MTKIEKKIVSKPKKDKRLLNVRDELLVDIQSYNQSRVSMERQSVENIETLQKNIFGIITRGLHDILTEEKTAIFDEDKNKMNGEIIKLNETNFDCYSIGSRLR